MGSSALSLGRSRGAAVLGQPLDVQFDVRLDQADEAGTQCFTAEVMAGDTIVDGGRVQVSVYNNPSSLDARVRVRTSSVMNEPVVSVVLRSQCGQNASRRYDFLTEFPVETRSAAVPTVIPGNIAASTPAATPTPAPAPPPAFAAAPNANVAPAPAPAPAVRPPRPPAPAIAQAPAPAPVRRPPAVLKPKPPAVAAAPAPAAEPKAEAPRGRPRLQLDVAPTPDDRQVVLKPSTEMISTPAAENGPQRADAAAAWRALNPQAQPAENPEDKKRLQTLEAEARALRAQLAKRDEEFQARLDRLENTRYDGNVVYALLGLLLAMAAAAAYWWNRARKTTASVADWSRHDESDLVESTGISRNGRVSVVDVPLPVDEDEDIAPMRAPVAAPAPAAPVPPVKPILADALPEVIEGKPTGFRDSVFDDLQALSAVTAPKAAPARMPAPAAAPLRGVSADEFLDTRQHADFFVSLGQYDQAIGLLKQSIDESIELNPLAYLELLKIYQMLGRQDDYSGLRDDFNRVFNGRVPPFSSFKDEGHGLEEYPSAMLKIEKSWGEPAGVELLESLLFRAPGEGGTQQFDLAAYRDLLMLYAIAKGDGAKRIGSPSSALSAAKIASAPSLAPAPVAAATAAAAELMPDLDLSLDSVKDPLPVPTVESESHTKPMLLMSEMAKIEDGAPTSSPAPTASNEPLDLDLDLNLDFVDSTIPTQTNHSAPNTDLDLPLLDDLPVHLPKGGRADPPTGSPGFPSAPPVDSNLIEFDLFDPKIEAKISPKQPK